jgi:hypothetical protein
MNASRLGRLSAFLLASMCAEMQSACGPQGSTPVTQSPPPTPQSPTGGRRPPADAPPALTVAPGELTKDYNADEADADKRYKDKVLEISGVIQEGFLSAPDAVERDVSVEGDEPTHFIFCRFVASAAPRVTNLTKGQQIKLRGKCAGMRMPVFLIDCELIDVGPDPAAPVTAAELAREFAKDKKAAEEKYKGKQLLIEGVVVRTEVEERGIRRAYLEGFNENADQSILINAGFHYAQLKDLVGLKKGQKVKLKGECRSILDGNVFVSDVALMK